MHSPSGEPANGTPSHPPVNRTLNFSAAEPKISATVTGLKRGRPGNTSKKEKKKAPFDLSISDDEEDPTVEDTLDPSLLNGGTQDDIVPQMDDEPMEQENTIQSIEGEESLQLPGEDSIEPDITTGAMLPPPAPPNKGGGRKPPKPSPKDPDESVSVQEHKRGRPGRKPKIHQDITDQQATNPNPKPGRGKRKAPFTERDPNMKMKTAKTSSKPPSRAGSAAPGSSSSYIVQRSETPATDSGAFTTRSGRTSIKPLASWRGEKVVFGQRSSRGSLAGISEVVRTDEVPAPSKRRNYGYRGGSRRARAGTAQSLHGIEEEEDDDEELAPWEAEPGIHHAMVMQWNPEIGKYDEENIEQLGTYQHPLPQRFPFSVLNPVANIHRTEIAFAADAIEMRDIKDQTFKFAKTLTLPFFGAGMVHLPPGGEKRVKNSRKMQMVFFVFYGRVTVNVGTPTTTFSIGKGGQWQVPRGEHFSFVPSANPAFSHSWTKMEGYIRTETDQLPDGKPGNFYSIINESDRFDARLFFAQGCQWNGEVEEGAMVVE